MILNYDLLAVINNYSKNLKITLIIYNLNFIWFNNL